MTQEERLKLFNDLKDASIPEEMKQRIERLKEDYDSYTRTVDSLITQMEVMTDDTIRYETSLLTRRLPRKHFVEEYFLDILSITVSTAALILLILHGL